MNIEFPYSFSHRACWIQFVGGPKDGQYGLYDHCEYDSIAFGYFDEKNRCRSYVYVPIEFGEPIYIYKPVNKEIVDYEMSG